MIGFQKRILDDEFYLIHKLKGNFKCIKCVKNVSSIKYYHSCWVPICEICFKKNFYETILNVDYIFKNHYKNTLRHLWWCLDRKLHSSVYFYIGKYVKERNRNHKFERYCYHFHKQTCKTIYQFCLFAKRYYPIHLNKDIRFKICKLILEE